MLELYDYEIFASPTKVRLALAEKGLEWTRRRVDVSRLEHKSPDYLALNPAGLIPTLRHDDALLVEADVILEYLEDTFEGPSLRPADTFERAWMRLWLKTVESMHESYSVAFQDQIGLPLQRARPVEELRAALAHLRDPFAVARLQAWIQTDIEASQIEAALGRIDAVFEQMEGQLGETEWLTGDTFSLADIALVPYVDTPMHLVSALWYKRRPRIAAWLDRVRARPSYAAAVLAFPPTPEVAECIANASAGGGRRVAA